ncbi:hypothetical protein NC652_036531 [Populus alba x Populus x berolinensis]|nr:hypothetical protein NC652_036531 [Populus alba x Populus x berolinensis]
MLVMYIRVMQILIGTDKGNQYENVVLVGLICFSGNSLFSNLKCSNLNKPWKQECDRMIVVLVIKR